MYHTGPNVIPIGFHYPISLLEQLGKLTNNIFVPNRAFKLKTRSLCKGSYDLNTGATPKALSVFKPQKYTS